MQTFKSGNISGFLPTSLIYPGIYILPEIGIFNFLDQGRIIKLAAETIAERKIRRESLIAEHRTQISLIFCMLQVTGDCVIEMVADFQDPVDMIPKYVKAWEEGYKIVIGIKTSSKENKIMYALRSFYYKTIKKLSDVEQIEHFTGSGLYDRDFIEVLRKLDDPTPFLRGIVAELGYKRKEIPYEQPKRRAGKTHNNFYRLYDAAMLSVTSYTKAGLRLATFVGAISAFLSMVVAVAYLVMKLIWWDRFPAGMAPMLIGMLFLGSVQIFFIGMVGEYVLSINQRVMHRPLVVEEERLNFEEK